MSHFYVAFAHGLYHYFGVSFKKGNRYLDVGSAKDLVRLAVIKQSASWNDYELRNYNHQDFPKGVTLRHGRSLNESELQKLTEKVPSAKELEKMFRDYA